MVFVRFSACAVPHVSSKKETRSKSLRRSRQRKSILCGSSASPRLMMEALKCVPKPVRDVSDSVILLQASFGHEMAGILYSSHVCAVSKWACFPTHTSNHAMSHLLCLKN